MPSKKKLFRRPSSKTTLVGAQLDPAYAEFMRKLHESTGIHHKFLLREALDMFFAVNAEKIPRLCRMARSPSKIKIRK